MKDWLFKFQTTIFNRTVSAGLLVVVLTGSVVVSLGGEFPDSDESHVGTAKNPINNPENRSWIKLKKNLEINKKSRQSTIRHKS